MEKEVLNIENVTKTFGSFTALENVSLTIREGEFVTIVGKSGSGKSTLLNMISGIDSPTSGKISVAGKSIHNLSLWRGKNIGVVFQFFQLLPTLTIAENVMLPMDFCGTYPSRERRKRAIVLLEMVGIADQADKLPSTLSGGQQQRAAIARALANDPPVITADEPTGNLDSKTSEIVLELFSNLRDNGKTIVLVTHERDLSQRIDRKIIMVDGVINDDIRYLKEDQLKMEKTYA